MIKDSMYTHCHFLAPLLCSTITTYLNHYLRYWKNPNTSKYKPWKNFGGQHMFLTTCLLVILLVIAVVTHTWNTQYCCSHLEELCVGALAKGLKRFGNLKHSIYFNVIMIISLSFNMFCPVSTAFLQKNPSFLSPHQTCYNQVNTFNLVL